VEDQQIKHTKECEEKRSNAATMRTNRCQSWLNDNCELVASTTK
jgi:hypothetical protein